MYVERFTDPQGRLFIKFPLINNLKNQRDWRATAEANERYARTAINKPVTLMLNKEESKFNDYHPFSLDPNATMADHVKFASRYGYGIVTDVTKESGKYKAASGEIPWFAIAEIIDPVIAEELKRPETKLVPPAFSPGVIHPYHYPDDAIGEYEIVHIASVPEGAYGPSFIKVASCAGDQTSCLPVLKAASYVDRFGICPKDVFSSLLSKSASSDNKMSLNSVDIPAPTAPVTGNRNNPNNTNSAVRTDQGQPQEQRQPAQQKPTIRIPVRRNRAEGKEPNGNGEGNGNGNGQENGENNANANIDVNKRIAELERRDLERETTYGVKDILRNYPRLFTDAKGRYQEKKFNEQVEQYTKQVLNKEVNLSTVAKLVALEARNPEVPEIRRASAPSFDDFIAPVPKGASSLESDEGTMRHRKLAGLFSLVQGGA